MHQALKALLGFLTGSRGSKNNGQRPARRSIPRNLQEQLDFSRLEQLIGYPPRDWALFVEAILHRSYTQHMGDEWRSNERLEFLGDAVLNLLVAEHLHTFHPNKEEGELTKIRSRLVNRRILAQRSRKYRIKEFLLLSTSAAQSIDQGSDSILSDAFEAIIGAVYVDGGLDAARKFVNRTLLSPPEVLAEALTDDNYKSSLLEYAQARSLGVPRYAIIKEEGPDHDRWFTVEVFVGTRSFGSGSGKSKKDAEQAAAEKALEWIHTKKDNDA